MPQLSFLDLPERPVAPRDPNIDQRDVKRATGKCNDILARLRQGRASNAELASITMKFTQRISDLRGAGYTVKSERGEGGLWWYWVESGA